MSLPLMSKHSSKGQFAVIASIPGFPILLFSQLLRIYQFLKCAEARVLEGRFVKQSHRQCALLYFFRILLGILD